MGRRCDEEKIVLFADGGGGSGGDNTFQNAEHPHQGQLVDWDTLQIVERQDEEEGRMELIDEDQMYVLLGLRDEDDKAEQAAKEAVAAASADGDKGKAPAMEDTHGAAIPVDDDIPGERMILYDPNKPSMDLGTVYPSMEEFRLAVRQFAINEEFELKIVKTCPKNMLLTVELKDAHGDNFDCWTQLYIQCKEADYYTYKCLVCKGRQIALKKLYGSWEDSFQMLFNWKAEVMKRSPGSVIEIGIQQMHAKALKRQLRMCFLMLNKENALDI
ncbi:uncharacterized protein LOC120667900 [Panicum virgatum]|uniref:uncharacterized protein LOC120667900 n=1 Tax=Panicum virgatum TaxID=38727 RepID=UPI0019D66116|nr:uncharacterized protein LOC120667900 [Panicum virgatum]